MVIHQKSIWNFIIRLLWLICVTVVFSLHLYSQDKVSDLEKKLPAAQGAERLRILTRLATSLHLDNPKKAIEYGQEALKILKTNPDSSQEISVLTDIGWAYLTLSDYENATAY